MLRTSHKPLFRNGAINDVHDIFGWRAYARGESEVLLKNAWPPNPRLRKCEILPLCTATLKPVNLRHNFFPRELMRAACPTCIFC